MSKCMDCNHWSPKDTAPGMSRFGFAVCLKKPTPWRTFSANARACEQFKQAPEEVTGPRHAKWDDKTGGRNANA